MHSEHCFVRFNEDGSILYSGTAVLRGANGDEIRATYAGNMFMPTTPGQIISSNARLEVTGGTGRFAGATGEGEGVITVTATAPPSPIQITMKGTIVY